MSVQAMRCQIFIRRCEESGVFIVDHSDIPGLHLEAETIPEMIDAIDDIAPELIKYNIELDDDVPGVWIEVVEQHVEQDDVKSASNRVKPKLLIDQDLLAA
ncbi:MAG: DUF1902 domain-containing protein [Gammaproteobacteria bacterium]|nr:DUF1902 domain-containing protein [Gammaproteobacteria bacterium]